MKSLDEVIKDLQEQIDDDMNCEYSINWIIDKHDVEDAIHYMKELKEARDIIATAREEAKIQIEDFKSDFMNKIADNPPLTWDEVKRMKGKPIWMEWQRGTFAEHGRWAIVLRVNADAMNFATMDDTNEGYNGYLGHAWKADYGTYWQAYRKERE